MRKLRAMLTRSARGVPTLAVLLLILPLTVPTASAQVAPAEGPPSAEQARRPRRVDPFAGQKRIRALVVTGGCCHDYVSETKVLMDAMATEAPVDWTVVLETEGGPNVTRTKAGLYKQPNWAAGYDIVVHNECYANVDDGEFVRNIVAGHTGGVPAIVIHCAMHSYRALESDEWRELLGVTTRRHTQQHHIQVKVTDAKHPVMSGFRQDWATPNDELYVIEKLWPNAKALATAVSPEDGAEYPLIWVNDYHGARVFGTTIGHGPETWDDPAFRDLLVRGFKWAVNRQ